MADWHACAALVEKGDPDRFMAVMSCDVAARARLFPLFAFNLEVARAPWMTQEPMIAEMRLQWWRDALAEIEAGGFVRRHEVVTPLATVISDKDARQLDVLVEAREWDVEPSVFPDESALWAYLDATAGGLIAVAARALGGPVLDGSGGLVRRPARLAVASPAGQIVVLIGIRNDVHMAPS